MKKLISSSLLLLVIVSCKSIPGEVKENKSKFLQVAKESSTKVELTNIEDIYNQAKLNNIESKMHYLDVDQIETSFDSKNAQVNLDSVVVFTKSGYKIFYDFANIPRPTQFIKETSKLDNFEVLDSRLYIGK